MERFVVLYVRRNDIAYTAAHARARGRGRDAERRVRDARDGGGRRARDDARRGDGIL